MAKKKKETGYVFLPSFARFIELLPEDQQIEMFWAITEYGLYGKKPDKGSTTAASLELIIPVIDASQNRYKAAVENGKKGAEFGKLGGRPRKTPEYNQKKPQKKPQDIDIESDIESEVEADSEEEAEDDSESKKEKKKETESESNMLRNQTEQEPVDNVDRVDNFSFSGNLDSASSAYPLTVGEVRTYCQKNGLYTDPERFFEYHSKRNWVLDDGRPVRDWKLLAMSKTWNVKETAPEQPETMSKRDEAETIIESKIISIPPPSDLEEVRQYCDQRNLEYGMDNFYEYFKETGWTLAGKRIRNWKSALLCWYEIEERLRKNLEYICDANVARELYSHYGSKIF